MELKKLKRHHVVVTLICAIVVALFGLLGKLVETSDQIMTFFEKLQASNASPKLTQFALSENSYGYIETIEFVFGEGPREVRTFGQVPTLLSPPSLVFQITLQNPSSQDLLVTDVTYDVVEVGQVRSDSPSPIESNKRYKHNLRWAVGQQLERLVPVYRIPANTTGSFEVEITTDPSSPPGSGVLMTVAINTNLGTAKSENFQVYLPVLKGDLGIKEQPPPSMTESFQVISNAEMPDPDTIDSVIAAANIVKYCEVEHFDRLERDMLFMRTASRSFDDYSVMTTTAGAKPYSAVFPLASLKYFYLAAREVLKNPD